MAVSLLESGEYRYIKAINNSIPTTFSPSTLIHHCKHLNQLKSVFRYFSLRIVFSSEFIALAKSWTRENLLSASLSFKGRSTVQGRDCALGGAKLGFFISLPY